MSRKIFFYSRFIGMEDDECKIKQGFDRNIDLIEIKERLIKKLNELYEKQSNIDEPKKIIYNQICYIIIALLQLRNGSRISEAVNAFLKYMTKNDVDEKVIVKIAKSEGMKYDWKTKTKKMKKPRFRKIMFPEDYIDLEIFYDIKDNHQDFCIIEKLKICQRVRDYLLKYFNCNTHSLRYAFINYMLYSEKRNLADIAKFVGHTTVNQLVTYTQNKNIDQIFDLKM